MKKVCSDPAPRNVTPLMLTQTKSVGLKSRLRELFGTKGFLWLTAAAFGSGAN